MAQGAMDALEAEVEGQPAVLSRFARTKLPKAAPGTVFVGAGDSYAAALAGFYASGGRCLALDPYSLAESPGIAAGLEVYFISVSGRTASNVLAARNVKGVARGMTAITAADGSKLATSADRVVKLPMAYEPRTPGMLSFALSLLAVLKISSGEGACDFGGAMRNARKESGSLTVSRKGITYFLGNSLAYPAALYAAAKAYEILGARSHAELLEEFSHLELFSLRKSDAVNIFSPFDSLGMSSKLSRALRKEGYESRVVADRGETKAERLFHAVFASQQWVLAMARTRGLDRPDFLSRRGRLRVSDSMIY